MRNFKVPSLYQQTLLNVDPGSKSSLVDLSIPPAAKRRRIGTGAQDEEAFSQSLASESSIHFRPSGASYPHAVLYRVIDNRRVLELQALDLRQISTKTEALLTLRFDFANQIRQGTIAFAEAEREGGVTALAVFIATIAGELFSLTLRKEAFVKAGFLDETSAGSSDWYQGSVPSAFTLKTPFKLLARNETELWASMNDGSIAKLERPIHGTTWRETYYTEGGWGSSLRAMIKWQAQQAVAFNDTELSANTPISMVFSPDLTHLWTACLDHTLKVWNVRTGKLAIHMDLGGDMSRDLRKAAERLLAPNHAQLIKIIPSRNEEHFTVAVFSPKNQAVKFWTVRDVEAAAYGMEDARPDFEFVLPVEDLVDANVWTLESFEVKAPTRQDEPWELWILVRSGLQCHVYTIDFRFNDHLEGLKRLWGHNWTAVACANNTHNLKHNPENPSDLDPSYFLASPEGPVELWTKFLFHPGRFTESTLETALAIYRRSLGRDVQRDLQQSFSKDKSIQERISEAVGTFISLGQVGGVVAYEKYQHEIAAQWQIFYGVVKDLHKRREDLLSLCLDPVDDIPWVVTADQVSPLRKSAEVELLWYNRKTFACPESFQPRNPLLEALTDSRNSKVGQFFNAIAVFKNTFSKPFLFSLRTILKSEVLRSGRADTSQQIESLYSRSGFANQVTDDDYNVLKASLEPLGGFAQLDGDTIYTILQLLDETQKGRTQKNQLTKYGSRFLITGARETLQFSYEIVVDALLLVIFAAVELEQGDMPEEFDTHLVFEALMQKAKEYELLEYLSSTLRQESSEAPQPHHNPLDSTNGNGAENGASATTSITLLEALFIGDWASMMFPQGAEVDLLTYSCRAWTFGARLYEQYDVIASHVFGNLLKSGDRELAFEFLRFLPDTAWSQYLRARMHLTRNEFVEAFVYFERAAPELATGKYFDIEQFDSAHLLGPHERMQMNDGLAHYYSHILALFETARVMSYVADTAELALRSYDMEDTQEPALKTELLSRLFTASIQTSRFNTAFNTLIQYTDFALRRSALHTLLTALLSASQTTLLLSLPFPASVASEVDTYLATLAAKASSSSSLSTFTPSSLSHPTAPPTKTPPHKILYAYRISRGDLKGAASCLWTRLQTLQQQRGGGGGGAHASSDAAEAEISETYLALINALSLVEPADAWILTRPLANAREPPAMPDTGLSAKLGRIAAAGEAKGKTKAQVREKRKVLTLADVRRLWQAELDRQADLEAGRFPVGLLVGGGGGDDDEMDVDVFG